MEKNLVLSEYFGHDTFRPGQEELIDAILSGQDTLGIMPTGGGKSICYQVPALMLPGITLVISPLISLMRDQVLALTGAGIPAAFLNSSLTAQQQSQVFQKLRSHAYKILYIAPERLMLEGFLNLAQSMEISLIAIDEAHCVSQWGQDFRPNYLKIPDFVEALPQRPPLAAFTATATPQVREDIEKHLCLRSPHCVVTGFDRPNLFFEVIHPREKQEELLRLVKARQDKSGIVYCATRNTVEAVCDALQKHSISAVRYHAGLSKEERDANQEAFLFDRAAVMVATNAFGMGIDKSNVSYVIHYNMPKSIEAYYQEAGRAGRDGTQAECLLLFSPADIQTAKFLISRTGDNNEEMTEEERSEIIRRDTQRLSHMIRYCKTTTCLRQTILHYFGQAHPDRCGSCANCKAMLTETEITTEAQMILSCVKRIYDALGYHVGVSLLLNTLRGSAAKRIKELKLDKLKTYGLMKNVPPQRLRLYIERLEELELLKTDPLHGGIGLTPKAGGVLFCAQKVFLPERIAPQAEITPSKNAKAKTSQQAKPVNEDLYEVLRKLRKQIADRENIPAFMVFSNAALEDMAGKKPKTLVEFRGVSGVGEVKAARYGKAFVEEIREFEKNT